MDRVLEQRAPAGNAHVGAPGRAVDSLVRDVLIVAEHHGQHATCPFVAHELAHPAERRQEAQDETHLVDDAGACDARRHTLGRRGVERQRLLAEHRDTGRGGLVDQASVLHRPRRHVHGIDESGELVLAHDRGPVLGGERRRPSPVGVVNGDDLVVDPAGPQRRDMEAADEARAIEADPHRHRPILTEAQANGRRRGR